MRKHIYPHIILASAVVLMLSPAWADAPGAGSSAETNKAQTETEKKSTAKKEWISTEVNSAIAVKNNPTKEINLPGVMKIEGASTAALDFSRTRTIQMNNGGSVSVYLSATEPNRIQLPFVNPHVIGTTDVMIDKRARSNNIYIAFKQGVTKAVPIFIETDDGSGPVLGLQLIPKGIASQTIIVEDVALRNAVDLAKANKGSDYVAATQGLMETVAYNATPNGYSIVEINVPPIAMNGLLVEVEKKLSNREADIFVYRVLNPGPSNTTVRESEFDGDLVQAVSIHPTPNLRAGESTKVIVLARKEQKAKGQ